MIREPLQLLLRGSRWHTDIPSESISDGGDCSSAEWQGWAVVVGSAANKRPISLAYLALQPRGVLISTADHINGFDTWLPCKP